MFLHGTRGRHLRPCRATRARRRSALRARPERALAPPGLTAHQSMPCFPERNNRHASQTRQDTSSCHRTPSPERKTKNSERVALDTKVSAESNEAGRTVLDGRRASVQRACLGRNERYGDDCDRRCRDDLLGDIGSHGDVVGMATEMWAIIQSRCGGFESCSVTGVMFGSCGCDCRIHFTNRARHVAHRRRDRRTDHDESDRERQQAA